MFDSVTIRGSDGPDFGLLAESLLFYGHVTLVLNAGDLKALLRVCGYEVVRELFDMGVLSITYIENSTGVRTTDTGSPNERHDFIVFDSPKLHLQTCLPEVLRELIGKTGKARRTAERLKPKISTSRYPPAINDATLEDITSVSFITTAVASAVRYLAPGYRLPDSFIFDVIRDGAFVRVATNLDFAAVNVVYHRRVDPRHSTITPAYLLSFIHQATADLQMAASANSEMALPPITTHIALSRLESVFQGRLRSEESLRLFQEFAFDDARAVREAVNERHRNMAEVVALVRSAERFRGWVKAQPEDADLRRAYLCEVSKLGWSEKLPRKTARWGIFTAAGIVLSALTAPTVGTVAGAALNAIDSFLVDRLIQGWKPNQFIEGPLKKFLGNEPPQD